MKTSEQKEYIAPEVKVVEVIVEEGFAVSGIIFNDRVKQEKHILDTPQEW